MPNPALSAASPVAAAIDQDLLNALTGEIARRLRIDRVGIAAGRAGSVEIGRVDIGETSIEAVQLRGLSARITCGAALLKKVRAILEIHFEVRWSYDLKWFGADSGIKALGSKAKPIPLHDIHIPMLQDIAIDVPEVTLTDAEADIQGIGDLVLGGAGFENLAIVNTRLPSEGFSLSGLAYSELQIASVGAPGADSERLTIARFSPDQPIAVPDVEVRGIQVPDIAVADAASDGAVSIMDIDPEDFEAPVFKIGTLFTAIFVARPILHLQVGELVLSDLKAKAAIEAVRVKGVRAPVTVRDIALVGLQLDQMEVQRIQA
jgi:hypothetical protein